MLLMTTGYAQETTTDGATLDNESSPSATKKTTDEKLDATSSSSFNVKEHLDWGSYYDPKNIFCGQYDCYAILGLNYEEYEGGTHIDSRIITKRYRALSREWHPDKSKRKDAKERFVVRVAEYEEEDVKGDVTAGDKRDW